VKAGSAEPGATAGKTAASKSASPKTTAAAEPRRGIIRSHGRTHDRDATQNGQKLPVHEILHPMGNCVRNLSDTESRKFLLPIRQYRSLEDQDRAASGLMRSIPPREGSCSSTSA
jgi:hypothetical protein